MLAVDRAGYLWYPLFGRLGGNGQRLPGVLPHGGCVASCRFLHSFLLSLFRETAAGTPAAVSFSEQPFWLCQNLEICGFIAAVFW